MKRTIVLLFIAVNGLAASGSVQPTLKAGRVAYGSKYNTITSTTAVTIDTTTAKITVKDIQINGSCSGPGCSPPGSGITNPGTATWVNTFGINVSTIVASSATIGNLKVLANSGDTSVDVSLWRNPFTGYDLAKVDGGGGLWANLNNPPTKIFMGGLPGQPENYAGLWLGKTTPLATNYVLLAGTNGDSVLNAVGNVEMHVNNNAVLQCNSSLCLMSIPYRNPGFTESAYFTDANNNVGFFAYDLPGVATYVYSRNAANVAFEVYANGAAQTGDLQRWTRTSTSTDAWFDNTGALHVTAPTGITTSSFTVTSGGSSGHATCWRTDTTIGYCSSVVDSSGNCTCN